MAFLHVYDRSDAMTHDIDVIVIGAGAAGMMCAAHAGKRGRRVWLIDHASKIAEKIRISGGGRCNFTNIYTRPETFLSANAHFCKSALSQYTQNDFIALMDRYNIAYHEKKLGQLFCDITAQDIIDMLVQECRDAGVLQEMETVVHHVEAVDGGYKVATNRGVKKCQSLVVATGGLSIPKIGATKFGYEIAKQFGLSIVPTRPALVPLTFQADLLDFCKELSGLSVEAKVSCGKVSFAEGLLFTHRGLSGPSILQISSYWEEGQDIIVDLAPTIAIHDDLIKQRTAHPKQDIQTYLARYLPKRLVAKLCEHAQLKGNLADFSNARITALADQVNRWRIRPSGSEGYRKAEVTLGGVATAELSSKTMESKKQPGLFFIGEVVDVTGHLGGFNFQWAWSCGYVCGQYV